MTVLRTFDAFSRAGVTYQAKIFAVNAAVGTVGGFADAANLNGSAFTFADAVHVFFSCRTGTDTVDAGSALTKNRSTRVFFHLALSLITGPVSGAAVAVFQTIDANVLRRTKFRTIAVRNTFNATTVKIFSAVHTFATPGLGITLKISVALNSITQVYFFALVVNTLITFAAIARLQTFVTLSVRRVANLSVKAVAVRCTAENTAAALLVPDIAALAAGASAAVTVADIRIRHRTVRAILRSILINRTVAAAHMILIV